MGDSRTRVRVRFIGFRTLVPGGPLFIDGGDALSEIVLPAPF